MANWREDYQGICPSWITVYEAADLTGYHPQYINTLINLNKIVGDVRQRAGYCDRDSALAWAKSHGKERK